jgi:hypothetical protein
MNFNNEDQLKAFLKSESKRLGVSVKNTYNTFFSRMLLERISAFNNDKLFVKGSFSELAHLDAMIRPITDIDLVSTQGRNDLLLVLCRVMYEKNTNIKYELVSLPKRTKTGIYKISMLANFGKIKHPISIDFQELSKTLYEKDYKRIYPIFKEDNFFYIWTPTFEEHLAEKLCIVVESNKENVLNTRVKDFYDIYKLCGGIYDKEKLSYFFYHMLKDRKKIDVSSASVSHLTDEYINRHENLWNAMRSKYEFMDKTVDFRESVEFTKELISKEIENSKKVKSLKIRLR